MMNVSYTEFENKCEELVPKIEKKVKEISPNVKSVDRFFDLGDTYKLNLRVVYTDSENIDRSISLRVGTQQVMEENIEPVVKAISNAING